MTLSLSLMVLEPFLMLLISSIFITIYGDHVLIKMALTLNDSEYWAVCCTHNYNYIFILNLYLQIGDGRLCCLWETNTFPIMNELALEVKMQWCIKYKIWTSNLFYKDEFRVVWMNELCIILIRTIIGMISLLNVKYSTIIRNN